MKLNFLGIGVLFLVACKGTTSLVADKHNFPSPVDTATKEITYQTKKQYELDGVYASNQFSAARLNNFTQLNDSTFIAAIAPENSPINPSPWYAFKLWSTTKRNIYIQLAYANNHKHRYNPKLSSNGDRWVALDTNLLQLSADKTTATMKLEVSADTLWVAAQEIQDSKRVGDWTIKMAKHSSVTKLSAGKSALGRDLYHLNITNGENHKKPTIIIISRQHPPEVTGYLCMKSFVETIIKDGATNGFLDKYRVMVYPLLNPDGVDLGHYRHNTGGVDLNRDWSMYRQPEIQQVTNHMVKETVLSKNEVLLGLDFHSTYYDVYYTPDETVDRKIPAFKDAWLAKIKNAIGLENINDKPGPINKPVSAGWFNQQFNATGITYEIGDTTPRDFIDTKGVASAKAMMDILLKE